MSVSVGVVGGVDLRAAQAGSEETLRSLSGRMPSLYAENDLAAVPNDPHVIGVAPSDVTIE